MKSALILLLAACCLLGGCHSSSQGQAQQTAAAVQDTMKAYGPPQVATSEGGYAMHAVVDGKSWKAAQMMAINAANENFIQGTADEVQIGFYIDLDHPYLGKERPLGEGHSADLTIGDGSWHAIKGGYTIDKADPALIEGRFHFMAQKFQSSDTLEVTDGRFRVIP